MATNRRPRWEPGKCRRCRKNPVQAPARICAACAKRSKAHRSSAGSSFAARGGAAGVLARSAASFPVANGSYYDRDELVNAPALETPHGR